MRWLNRLWNSFSSKRLHNDIQQELDSHFGMLEDAARERGLGDKDPRLEARKRLGSPAAHLEKTRDMSLWVGVHDAVQDARFALRQMRHQPGFTAVSVLVMAFGIGAVTTIFSLVNAVLVHSLPYQDPAQLVYLWTPNRQFGEKVPPELGPNYPDFVEWQRDTHSFSSMTALNQRVFNVSRSNGVRRIGGAMVAGAFFGTLGVEPALGRAFTAFDEQPGHDHVVVISDAAWHQLFAASRNALGSMVELNREKYVVIGVMPKDFGYPFEGDIPYGMAGFGRTDLWVPMVLTHADQTDRRNVRSADAAIARLKPGIGVGQAQLELAAMEKRFDLLYPPDLKGWTVLVRSLVDTIIGPVRMMLWILMGAVGAVLLIACGNVANLLLARATARQEEIAIRISLGAGRARLVRQMMTESVVLALSGCCLGVVLSLGAVHVLLRSNPGNIPRFDQATISWPVLLLAVSAALASGIAFGLAPALLASQFQPGGALRGSNGRTMGTARRLGRMLIMAEVALSFVLLASAGLLVRSYLKLDAQDPGYLRSTLTMNLPLDNRYNTPESRRALFRKFLERIRQIPGVRQAGAGSDIPLDHSESIGTVEVKGFSKPKNMIDNRTITPGYLDAFGMQMVAGRAFDEQDSKNADRVAIVNQAFAKAFIAGKDPLTVQVRLGSTVANRPWAKVIGVVSDRRHSRLEETPQPEYFQPYSAAYDTSNLHFAIRSLLTGRQVTASARRILRELDAGLALDDIRTMDQRMAEATARRRFETILLSTFGIIAIALALGGIYGVLSYSVRQRTREIGLRMAIGANQQQLFSMVLREGLGAVAVGLLGGALAALFLTRAISSWLFHVPSNDPLTYTVLSVLVLLTATIACLGPAREAIRVDPAVAMRSE